MIPADRVTPDGAALDRLAADDDRRDWWLARLERSYRVLDAG